MNTLIGIRVFTTGVSVHFVCCEQYLRQTHYLDGSGLMRTVIIPELPMLVTARHVDITHRVGQKVRSQTHGHNSVKS